MVPKKTGSTRNARNTLYSFSASITAKIGALFLTILLARLLQPELFGIYSLTLSIVLIVFMFSDLGINSALNTYISRALARGEHTKARSYLRYLIHIKLLLLGVAIVIMIPLAPFLAYVVYDKPLIFVPLLCATLYIVVNSFRSLFESLYYPTRDLAMYPITTFVLHGLRLLFSLIVLTTFAREHAVIGIFVAFTLASFIALATVLIALGKRRSLIFGKTGPIKREEVKRYLGFMSIASLSLVFFASIDTLMLGYFVDAQFIGFYRAALGIIASIVAILSLSNIFIPVFTQTKDKNLEGVFDTAFKYLFTISIPAAVGLVFVGRYAVHIIYGPEYSTALYPFYVLSFLILVMPFIKLYSSLFESHERTKAIAIITLASLGLNVVLNFVAIKYLLAFGQTHAIVGAASATLLSQALYLTFLAKRANTIFGVDLPYKLVARPLTASIVMGAVLYVYNMQVDISLLTGIIQIILGMLMYLVTLTLLKGITKKDRAIAKQALRIS